MSTCVSCLLESGRSYSDTMRRKVNDESVAQSEHIYYELLNGLHESKPDLYEKLDLIDTVFKEFDYNSLPYMTSIYDYKVDFIQTLYKDNNIGSDYMTSRLESMNNYASKCNDDMNSYMNSISAKIDELYANSGRKKKMVMVLSVLGLLGYMAGTVCMVLLGDPPSWYMYTVHTLLGAVVGVLYTMGFMYVLSDRVRCPAHRRDMLPSDVFKQMGADVKTYAQRLKSLFTNRIRTVH